MSILITGGNGYLGKCLTKKYLKFTDEKLILLVRAKDQTDLQNKIETLDHEFGFTNGRIAYFPSDISEEQPFTSVDPKSVNSIIHTASITRFDVSQEDANRVNYQGTNKLLQFADNCPNIEKIGLLSTVYSSGLIPGLIKEQLLSDELGFANYYEWSKWEAEKSAIQTFAHLPCFIFRSATIIADDDDGNVTQYNVFHNTLRLVYHGLLTLMPGNSQTPIYLVTGEFVTDAIFKILSLSSTKNQRIFNIAHSQDKSPSLGEIIDIGLAVFNQDEQFVKRRTSKPRYINLETFNIMMRQIQSFGSRSTQLAAGSMQPFAQQLFIAKDIKNAGLMTMLDEYQTPDIQELVIKTCHFLLTTNWGRKFL
jgi:nucleoside-diphosphate-sugar epimerase